jgi:stringent starvation protein B
MISKLTTRRPYLIRATYDWLIDNNLTPHILVDTKVAGVKVPVAHIGKDGRILLNVAPVAIRNLSLGLDVITFNAAFPGLKADIVLPIESIRAIYAIENGQGSMFDAELDGCIATKKSSLQNVASKKDGAKSKEKSKAKLTIVKKDS